MIAVFVVVASADDVTPRVAALRNLYRSVAPPLALAAAVALITCCSVNMTRQRESGRERATVSERVRARDSPQQS